MIPESWIIAALGLNLGLLLLAIVLLWRMPSQEAQDWRKKAEQWEAKFREAVQDRDIQVQQLHEANAEIIRLRNRLWDECDSSNWWKEGPTREDDGDD